MPIRMQAGFLLRGLAPNLTLIPRSTFDELFQIVLQRSQCQHEVVTLLAYSDVVKSRNGSLRSPVECWPAPYFQVSTSR
jgi:hypothetical protein